MGLLVTHGEFLAAFGPTCGQYPAAVGAAHALAEPVFIVALAPRWLESPFHSPLRIGAQM
jgi:hypothetical protein